MANLKIQTGPIMDILAFAHRCEQIAHTSLITGDNPMAADVLGRASDALLIAQCDLEIGRLFGILPDDVALRLAHLINKRSRSVFLLKAVNRATSPGYFFAMALIARNSPATDCKSEDVHDYTN